MQGRVFQVLQELVGFASVSSTENKSISEYVSRFLNQLGFDCELTGYVDRQGVDKVNVVATTPGFDQSSGGLVYCAHTDVVPVTGWSYEPAGPFELHQEQNRWYGRGSCDMKGSLACFLVALESIDLKQLRAPVSIICTADEEVGFQGAAQVAKNSEIFKQLCRQQPLTIIGEPTMLEVVHAHKGVYTFKVTSRGRRAHSGTNEGVNANLQMIPFLQEMKQIYDETLHHPEWNNTDFSPAHLSWNIGINDFTYASNITPGQSVCTISFRPMPGQNATSLLDRAKQKAESLGLTFGLTCQAAAVSVDKNAHHVKQMLELTGKPESLTVTYGTDAAMFSQLKKIVICGPGNIEQAHTNDEWIAIEQISQGVNLYRQAIQTTCLE